MSDTEHWDLVDANGEQVRLGTRLKTGGGQECVLVDFTRPHKPSSTGRIHVEMGDMRMEYFPHVCGLKFIRVDSPINPDTDVMPTGKKPRYRQPDLKHLLKCLLGVEDYLNIVVDDLNDDTSHVVEAVRDMLTNVKHTISSIHRYLSDFDPETGNVQILGFKHVNTEED